jgi:hypothetical protein
MSQSYWLRVTHSAGSVASAPRWKVIVPDGRDFMALVEAWVDEINLPASC